MFEWIVDTTFGRAMQKWSVVWQPAYDDIGSWKVLKDIGTYSGGTIKKWQEAWATVPKPARKDIYKVFLKLQKLIGPKILAKLIEIYFSSIKK